jgi:hypothetical protein
MYISFHIKFRFSQQIVEIYTKILNLMKIHPVRVELLHAEIETGGQTDMT